MGIEVPETDQSSFMTYGIDGKNLLFYRLSLVIRCRINITKASSRCECVCEWIASIVNDCDLGVMDCFARGYLCCSDVCDIGAAIPSVSLLTIKHGIRMTDLFGKPGLKMVELDPRQPWLSSKIAGPATPLSPDAKKTETPRIPSFMNLYQKYQLYGPKNRVNMNLTRYIVSVDIFRESRVLDHRTKRR
jgi:hypothetical protein